MSAQQILVLALCLAAGFVLGLVFYGGMLLTLYAVTGKERPGPWLVLSFVLRTAATLAGVWAILYYVGQGPFVSALAGFVLVRLLLGARLEQARATMLEQRKE
jgi:F1F0 ATPase subunit 2